MSWQAFKRFFGFGKPDPVEEPDTIDESVVRGKFLVINAGFESDGKMRIEAEYDAEFVQSLRARGYAGVDDEQVVMKYVADVYRTISASAELNYD